MRNVPQIRDVSVMIELIKSLGAQVQEGDHCLKITTPRITTSEPPTELLSKLRGSILVVGPLLARTGKVKFIHPGGDLIGKRSINAHTEGLEGLGFEFKQTDRVFEARKKSNPTEESIFLYEPSPTATENLLLTTALSEKKITIKNCAQEPHVADLCNMLVQMGVKIEGIGTSTLRVTGCKVLKNADFSIGPDHIEFGTYAISAAITKGEIEIEKISINGLEPITYHLRKMGVEFHQKNDSVVVNAKKIRSLSVLKVNVWPGFPTDLMSLVIVLATQAEGITLCHDWMYETRMFFVDKLIGMGAHITIADPHRVLVYGPSKLAARNLESPDIRAGMAMVLASLIAKGTSTINRAELIERGYENVVENLQSLGAQIERKT